jgi:hypothetical protein
VRLDKIEVLIKDSFEKTDLRINKLEGDHQERIDLLESDRDRKAGERGTIEKLFASPTLAWIVTALLGVAYAVTTHGEKIINTVTK